MQINCSSQLKLFIYFVMIVGDAKVKIVNTGVWNLHSRYNSTDGPLWVSNNHCLCILLSGVQVDLCDVPLKTGLQQSVSQELFHSMLEWYLSCIQSIVSSHTSLLPFHFSLSSYHMPGSCSIPRAKRWMSCPCTLKREWGKSGSAGSRRDEAVTALNSGTGLPVASHGFC